jgi:hypothetical protein
MYHTIEIGVKGLGKRTVGFTWATRAIFFLLYLRLFRCFQYQQLIFRIMSIKTQFRNYAERLVSYRGCGKILYPLLIIEILQKVN